MINKNSNSSGTRINFNFNCSSNVIHSSQQLSYDHFQPFRVSYSMINLKEQFLHSLQSKSSLTKYQLVKSRKENVLTRIKSMSNYHLLERNLIKDFLNSNVNVVSNKTLQQMWKSSLFCDLLLIVQGSEYLAHRLVLAAFSEKLKRVFDLRKSEFVTRVHLRQSTQKSLPLVLNYLYTDNLTLTMQNIDDILICIKELGIQKMLDLCIAYLSRINKRTIFQVLDLACKHKLIEVYKFAHEFLIESIDKCIQTKEFIDIDYWMLKHILSDETIHRRQESRVLDRTLLWLSCNHISNTEIIFELLNCIRWHNIKHSAVQEIISLNYRVLSIPVIKQWLIKRLE